MRHGVHGLSETPNGTPPQGADGSPVAVRTPPQLDGGRELATLLVDGADRSSLSLGDDEHARSMGICTKTGNTAGPRLARLDATLPQLDRDVWPDPRS
jgi:hypothetical protein